jgi:hypothetical protein
LILRVPSYYLLFITTHFKIFWACTLQLASCMCTDIQSTMVLQNGCAICMCLMPLIYIDKCVAILDVSI